MLLKAQITAINYNTNTYTVHIPYYDLPTSAKESSTIAQVCVPPGLYNGYQVGDMVWIGQEKDQIGDPVILGRLGVLEQASSSGGTVQGKTLAIMDSAKLPKNTYFDTTDSDYGSIPKIIEKLKSLETSTQGTPDLPNTLASFQATLDQYGNQLKNLESSGVGSSGGSDIDINVLRAGLNETVTITQKQSSLNTDFPIGKVLYVKNDTGRAYTFQSEVEIFPVFSLCTNYLTHQDPVVEFSDLPQVYTTTKLAGVWRVKDILAGGVLAQRYDVNNTELDSRITLLDGSTCYLKDSFGNALSYYDELTDVGVVHMSILSTELVFLNKNLKSITELTSNKEDDVTIHYIAKRNPAYTGDDSTEPKYIILQRYDGDPNKSDMDNPPDGNNNDYIDNVVILNIPSPIVNGGGYQCRFKTYTNQTTIFAHTNTSGAGTEAVILSTGYNLTYKNSYSLINEYLFSGASRLTKIYIPANTGLIKKGAFIGVGGALDYKNHPVQLLNFENSCVHNIKSTVFQNVVFEHNWLKLPKMPIDGVIYFAESAFSYYNYSYLKPKLRTLFVNSVIDFDHEYDEANNTVKTAAHRGAFVVTSGSQSHINNFALQLVYPTDKEFTYSLLKKSSLVSFFRSTTAMKNLSLITDEEPIFGSAINEILNQFKNINVDDFIAEATLTDNIVFKVRFINAKAVSYDLNSDQAPTIPTIIYNYIS